MPTLHWIGKEKVVKPHHDVPFKILQREYVHIEGAHKLADALVLLGQL